MQRDIWLSAGRNGVRADRGRALLPDRVEQFLQMSDQIARRAVSRRGRGNTGSVPNAQPKKGPEALVDMSLDAAQRAIDGASAAARPWPPAVPPAEPWEERGSITNRNSLRDRALNAARMYKVHIDRGMSPAEAAAWAANAEIESRGKHTVSQWPSGPGRGTFQWGSDRPEWDRRPDFQRRYGVPIEKAKEREQLDFRDWELSPQGRLASVGRRLAEARARGSSAGDIAEIIARDFEIAGDIERTVADRRNIANELLRLMRPAR